MMKRLRGLWMMCSLLLCLPAQAATYYVDFDTGDDANPGTSIARAFKHAPGDRNAAAAAAKVRLQPGDTVRFKGGVIYRGQIQISRSGAEGRPIVYDGNADGDYGAGRAVIDGSMPLTGLTPCTSAGDAWGNPNWRKLYWAYVPKGARWRTINLCQDDKILPISQDPNPADPLFQERPADYVSTGMNPPRTLTDIQVRYLSKHDQTGNRPLISMFDGSRNSAVIGGINGDGVIEIQTPQPVTVTELALTAAARYTQPKEVSFVVDGVEVLRANPQHHPDRSIEQRFALAEPVTFSKLQVRFLAAHPDANGTVRDWGAIQKMAAYDADGVNVLLTTRTTVLDHQEYFTQTDPSYYDNAVMALYASPAAVYYKRVLAYDPARHQIRVETLGHGQAPYSRGGAFAIVNSIRLIDRPGEYALTLDPETDGRHKVFVWPPNETPENLTYGRYGVGLSIQRASYITVQGFAIRKQGWSNSSGISARGKATDLIVRDVVVSNLRGNSVAIYAVKVDNTLVENCKVLDNAGHTKGILIKQAKNVVVRDCVLRRNTSTALDYYTVTNGVVQNCTLTDNLGMHANGLTFYLGCKDILVEGNTVVRGNAALTVQHGENMIIRNNIFSGSPAIGLWGGRAYDNIVITNNYLFFDGREGGTMAAIYGGNRPATGYTIANNIIDGLSGNVLRKAEIHHNIFTQWGPVLTAATLGDNLYVPEASTVVASGGGDVFGLAANSPAVDGGVALSSINAADINGVPRRSGAIDIGPWEAGMGGLSPLPIPADPATFRFTFDGYTIGPPAVVGTPGYESVFTPVADGNVIIVSALDHAGEGGGRSGKRLSRGFIMNWDNPGHWLEWTVDAPEAGPYELVIDHASEMPSVRQVALNGAPIEGLERVRFGATGDWHDFARKALPVAVNLATGTNTIRVTNVAGSLNFRTLRLIPIVSATAGEPRVVEPVN